MITVSLLFVSLIVIVSFWLFVSEKNMELQNLLSPFLLRRVKSEVRYHFTVINNIKSFLFISDMGSSVLTLFWQLRNL